VTATASASCLHASKKAIHPPDPIDKGTALGNWSWDTQIKGWKKNFSKLTAVSGGGNNEDWGDRKQVVQNCVNNLTSKMATIAR